MAFNYRWKPSKAQKREYAQRMQAIEAAKSEPLPEGYTINCTGDCVAGDNIAFFNPGKSEERIYGVIVKESYGADKQQHTFTIETDNGTMLIKGRSLYKNQVHRLIWEDENARKLLLDEKHRRGDIARQARQERKADNL